VAAVRYVGWIAGLLALLCGAAQAQPGSGHYSAAAAIERDRAAIAAQLVEPIARCVKRNDTDHVIFHGCIDWHSSVHGMLGLVLFGDISGNKRYDAFVEQQLAVPKLALEREMLMRNPAFEMPYGRAWFLRLAIEHERRYGSQKLRAMADDVAGSLKTFIAPRRSDLLEGDYGSISWALINLIDYAQATGNQGLLDFANGYARDALLRAGPRCSYQLERAEFMSICLQRAWLAAKVLTAPEFEPWHRKFMQQVGIPEAIANPTSAHHHGLNFSRSWALAALTRKTGLREYDVGFARHFEAGYRRRANWDGGYQTVAHWVAQFGMMALRLIGPQAPRR
jgi:hypothetical protein